MTLTELSYYVRRSLPFVIGSLIGLIILIIAITRYLAYLDALKPKSLVIDPIFGKINRIVLSKTIDYPDNPQFILDTIEGEPKTATETAKVFFLPEKTARFGYLQKAYLMAKQLGFETETVRHQIKNSQVTFEDEEKNAQIDTATFNFTYTYNYQNNESLFETATLPDDNQITEKTISFLKEVGRYPEELAQGKTNLIFLHYNPQTKEFDTVPKKNQANAVEIDFFRPDIDEFPIVSPTYFTSHNYVVAVFQNDQFNLIKAQLNFFEKEDQKVGIYPLKSGEAAWEALKNQQGLIVSPGKNMNQITIKKMMLGYLDSDLYQPYLQPVHVFLGNDGFVAYVQAVQEEYLE